MVTNIIFFLCLVQVAKGGIKLRVRGSSFLLYFSMPISARWADVGSMRDTVLVIRLARHRREM